MAQAGEARRPLGATISKRQRLFIFASMMLCMFLTAIDQSIVSTAIPHVLADLGGFRELPWVFTAYLLTSTVAIPIIGKLSDMFGRKTFLLWGIAVFVSSSVLCGAAPNMLVLIVARGLQGLGGGVIVACVFATLGDLFTPLERAKYFSLFVGMFTFAQLAGPTFGGILSDGPGWRWCFYINLPLGIGASVFLITQLPKGGGAGGRLADIDVLGATLLAISTVTFLLGTTWASGTFGWTSRVTVGLIAAALVVAVLFVVNERSHPQPIIPLQLFRNRPFVWAVAMTFFSAAGIFASNQYLPTYVQTSLGSSATISGLLVAPQAVGNLLSSIVGGQLVARTGRFKLQMIVGTALMVVGAFLTTRFGPHESLYYIAAITVLMGFGGGFVFPVTQVVVQGAVSQDQQGVASSTRQFFLLIGNTLGVATLGLVLTTSYVSAFAQESRSVASTIPQATYQQFNDPTLALDPARYDVARATIRSTPDGEATLELILTAQRDSVATAIDHVFIGTFISALCVLALALTLREFELRHSFDADDLPVVQAV